MLLFLIRMVWALEATASAGQTLIDAPGTCANMAAVCTGAGVSFAASVNAAQGPSGNVYCRPAHGRRRRSGYEQAVNPAWYYLQISNPGGIAMDLRSSNSVDVDFALWGPYADLAAAQADCGSLPTPIDDGFEPSSVESPGIPNSARAGEVYILLVMNWGNLATTITLSKASGSGTTSCTAVPGCVDCVGSWGPWGDCSNICGGGSRSRTYSVTTQKQSCGHTCDASDGQLEVTTCNSVPCPVDCVGSWSDWSECTVTCGPGRRSRRYTVTTEPQHNGLTCAVLDQDLEDEDCNVVGCPCTLLDVVGATTNCVGPTIASGRVCEWTKKEGYFCTSSVATCTAGDWDTSPQCRALCLASACSVETHDLKADLLGNELCMTTTCSSLTHQDVETCCDAKCEVPTVFGSSTRCTPGAKVSHGHRCTWTAEPSFTCTNEGEQLCSHGLFDFTPSCSQRCSVLTIVGASLTECELSSCAACCSFNAVWETEVSQGGAGTSIKTTGSSVRFDFEDDHHCGGTSGSPQSMTATATIHLHSQQGFNLLVTGLGEGDYEILTITVNGELVQIVQPQSDGHCSSFSCNMCQVDEQATLTLLKGANTIIVHASTGDAEYHKGAFFSLKFVKGGCSPDMCAGCSENSVGTSPGGYGVQTVDSGSTCTWVAKPTHTCVNDGVRLCTNAAFDFEPSCLAKCTVPLVAGASVSNCVENESAVSGTTCLWTAKPTHTCDGIGGVLCTDGLFSSIPACLEKCIVPSLLGAVSNCTEGENQTIVSGTVCTWSAKPTHTCRHLRDALCTNGSFSSIPYCEAKCSVPVVVGGVSNCTENETVVSGTTCTWSPEPTHTCEDAGELLCSDGSFSSTPSCLKKCLVTQVTGAVVSNCTEDETIHSGVACFWSAEPTHHCVHIGELACSNGLFSHTPACFERCRHFNCSTGYDVMPGIENITCANSSCKVEECCIRIIPASAVTMTVVTTTTTTTSAMLTTTAMTTKPAATRVTTATTTNSVTSTSSSMTTASLTRIIVSVWGPSTSTMMLTSTTLAPTLTSTSTMTSGSAEALTGTTLDISRTTSTSTTTATTSDSTNTSENTTNTTHFASTAANTTATSAQTSTTTSSNLATVANHANNIPCGISGDKAIDPLLKVLIFENLIICLILACLCSISTSRARVKAFVCQSIKWKPYHTKLHDVEQPPDPAKVDPTKSSPPNPFALPNAALRGLELLPGPWASGVLCELPKLPPPVRRPLPLNLPPRYIPRHCSPLPQQLPLPPMHSSHAPLAASDLSTQTSLPTGHAWTQTESSWSMGVVASSDACTQMSSPSMDTETQTEVSGNIGSDAVAVMCEAAVQHTPAMADAEINASPFMLDAETGFVNTSAAETASQSDLFLDLESGVKSQTCDAVTVEDCLASEIEEQKRREYHAEVETKAIDIRRRGNIDLQFLDDAVHVIMTEEGRKSIKMETRTFVRQSREDQNADAKFKDPEAASKVVLDIVQLATTCPGRLTIKIIYGQTSLLYQENPLHHDWLVQLARKRTDLVLRELRKAGGSHNIEVLAECLPVNVTASDASQNVGDWQFCLSGEGLTEVSLTWRQVFGSNGQPKRRTSSTSSTSSTTSSIPIASRFRVANCAAGRREKSRMFRSRTGDMVLKR